jgi:hypothetical protein
VLTLVWSSLKRWRRLNAGPLALHFAFRRSVAVKHSPAHRIEATTSAGIPCVSKTIDAPQGAKGAAVIVGVGPGLGQALALHLAKSGMPVVLVSRNARNQDETVRQIRAFGGVAFSHGCDATDEQSVSALFKEVSESIGVPSLVVYSLQSGALSPCLEVSVPAFEESWRHNCLGPFLVARAAGKLRKVLYGRLPDHKDVVAC